MRRRTFILGSAATVLTATSGHAQSRLRTPGQVLGPFYPVAKPADRDADMTRIAGLPERAAGQLVRITGQVLDADGRPVPQAEIEVWQADAAGRYNHPADRRPGRPDPAFQGYATIRSDSRGRYRFTTVKPGAYPDDGAGRMRAPHIHFQVTGRVNRLVTQMYFPGEPLNDRDRLLAFAFAGRDRLIARRFPSGPARGLDAEWDIVLRDG